MKAKLAVIGAKRHAPEFISSARVELNRDRVALSWVASRPLIWRLGEDESENFHVIVMPINLR